MSQASQSQSKKRSKFVAKNKSKPPSNTTTVDFSEVKEDQRPLKKAITFDGDDEFMNHEDNSRRPRFLAALTEEDDLPSSASTTTAKLFTFDGTPEPDDSKVPESPPTSPEDHVQKEVSKEPESTMVACPVCHNDVDHTKLPSAEKNPRLLSMKKQQDWCRRHRLGEAGNVHRDRNYPNIDWQVLGVDRIPNQIPHLRKVLQRKAKCYYLNNLESNISKAKGNRKTMRNYLTEGVLDTAKAGYYGPKGTKMMMDSIVSNLSQDLNKMTKDKLFQSVGLGGYVTAVLVPEMTMRLVMDDMSIKDEAQARRVMDESTDIGLLLHPDDDHIEQLVID